MEIFNNIQIKSQRYKKRYLADIFFEKNGRKKPVILFSHGFKSFKDWGTFNLLASYFAEKGFVFIKFNFPFDGTTIDNPLEITDLDSFRKNNYLTEMDNLEETIDWVITQQIIPEQEIDKNEIYLMGHSRGAVISILVAAKDARVKKVAGWSAFNDIEAIMNCYDLEQWKQDGVRYTPDRINGRLLPMDYSNYTEFVKNREHLSIEKAITGLKIPVMLVHGTEDDIIGFEDSLKMKEWNKLINLSLLPLVNHIYGGHHPYNEEKLPYDTLIAANETIDFLKDNL